MEITITILFAVCAVCFAWALTATRANSRLMSRNRELEWRLGDSTADELHLRGLLRLQSPTGYHICADHGGIYRVCGRHVVADDNTADVCIKTFSGTDAEHNLSLANELIDLLEENLNDR